MAYGDLKVLPRRTTSDILLQDKSFDTDKNPKSDRYQCGIA